MPDPFDSFQLPSELRELLPKNEHQPLQDEILDIHVRLLKRDPELEDSRSRGLHLWLLFNAIAKRLQSLPDFREHVVTTVIPTFVERIKSDLSWYPNSDENLGYFLKPVIVHWQNSDSKKVEAPLLNNTAEGENAGEFFHPTAPAFRYEYPPDLPDTEQLAIENARLEANRSLESKEVRSFDDYRSAYVAWFWQLVSAAANAIGRAGERLQWGANRRRELLKDYSLKAAKAADIAGKYDYRFKDLCDSREWRAADDCLLQPTAYDRPGCTPESQLQAGTEDISGVPRSASPEVDGVSSAGQPETAGSAPPRRSPDLEMSRERVLLLRTLSRELATIKMDLKGFCEPAELKSKHAGFTLWNHITGSELSELISGTPFTPKAFAENLVLRHYGLTSRESLKKDRQKLRKYQNTTQ